LFPIFSEILVEIANFLYLPVFVSPISADCSDHVGISSSCFIRNGKPQWQDCLYQTVENGTISLSISISCMRWTDRRTNRIVNRVAL